MSENFWKGQVVKIYLILQYLNHEIAQIFQYWFISLIRMLLLIAYYPQKLCFTHPPKNVFYPFFPLLMS